MKDKYRCFFSINPNVNENLFKDIEETSAIHFRNFVEAGNYGDGVRTFWFRIFVSPIINYGEHRDGIYKGNLQISAHVDYDRFQTATQRQKEIYILNAAFVMLEFFRQRMIPPSKFDIQRMIVEYEIYLGENAMLLAEEELHLTIIKPFDAFRFNFLVTKSWEVKDAEIHFDLNEIQDYINNNLIDKKFGDSVRCFDFGYEMYDYAGEIQPSTQTANLMRYGAKHKRLLVVKQFNYRQFEGKTFEEQFAMLKEKIDESIRNVSGLKKKPSSFDVESFHSHISEILKRYEEEMKKKLSD
jgi:hypothetical protein